MSKNTAGLVSASSRALVVLRTLGMSSTILLCGFASAAPNIFFGFTDIKINGVRPPASTFPTYNWGRTGASAISDPEAGTIGFNADLSQSGGGSGELSYGSRMFHGLVQSFADDDPSMWIENFDYARFAGFGVRKILPGETYTFSATWTERVNLDGYMLGEENAFSITHYIGSSPRQGLDIDMGMMVTGWAPEDHLRYTDWAPWGTPHKGHIIEVYPTFDYVRLGMLDYAGELASSGEWVYDKEITLSYTNPYEVPAYVQGTAGGWVSSGWEALSAPIPEPSTYALLTLGVAGLVWHGRRKGNSGGGKY